MDTEKAEGICFSKKETLTRVFSGPSEFSGTCWLEKSGEGLMLTPWSSGSCTVVKDVQLQQMDVNLYPIT